MDIVNGYQCRNCTDIDYAKRHIDPAHPKDGPYGINKSNGVERGPAVLLGGALAPAGSVSGVSAAGAVGSTPGVNPAPPQVTPAVYRPGATLNVSA